MSSTSELWRQRGAAVFALGSRPTRQPLNVSNYAASYFNLHQFAS